MPVIELGQLYVVDSSSIIDLHDWYSPSVFPTLYQKLDVLVSQGRLIIPREVADECAMPPGKAWVDSHPEMIRDVTDPEHFACVQQVTNKHYKQAVAYSGPHKNRADPMVIALALWRGNQGAASVMVVTEEQSVRRPALSPPSKAPTPSQQVKIPDVCDALKIKHCRVRELFGQEGWSF